MATSTQTHDADVQSESKAPVAPRFEPKEEAVSEPPCVPVR